MPYEIYEICCMLILCDVIICFIVTTQSHLDGQAGPQANRLRNAAKARGIQPNSPQKKTRGMNKNRAVRKSNLRAVYNGWYRVERLRPKLLFSRPTRFMNTLV